MGALGFDQHYIFDFVGEGERSFSSGIPGGRAVSTHDKWQLFSPCAFHIFKLLLEMALYHLVGCFDLAIDLWMTLRGERLLDL